MASPARFRIEMIGRAEEVEESVNRIVELAGRAIAKEVIATTGTQQLDRLPGQPFYGDSTAVFSWTLRGHRRHFRSSCASGSERCYQGPTYWTGCLDQQQSALHQ